jgi:hypothetical protein
MKRNQRGMTLLSFLVVVAVGGFAVYIGAKVFPMYQEYYAVRTAMKGLASDPRAASLNPGELRKLLFRRLDINYVSSVDKEHVKFERISGGWRLNVNYEARTGLFGNLDLIGRFESSQDLTKSGIE